MSIKWARRASYKSWRADRGSEGTIIWYCFLPFWTCPHDIHQLNTFKVRVYSLGQAAPPCERGWGGSPRWVLGHFLILWVGHRCRGLVAILGPARAPPPCWVLLGVGLWSPLGMLHCIHTAIPRCHFLTRMHAHKHVSTHTHTVTTRFCQL